MSMARASARLTQRQRKGLSGRARRHDTSVSAQVRKAVDLYLDLVLARPETRLKTSLSARRRKLSE